MRYEQFPPDRALAAWVECYWRLTGSADVPPRPQRILPDGSTEIIVHVGDPFARLHDDGRAEAQPRRLFVGQMTRALRVVATGHTCVWGIRLHPWAGAVVAGVPAHELTDRITCSDDVCPRLAGDLSDALLDACARTMRADLDGTDDDRASMNGVSPGAVSMDAVSTGTASGAAAQGIASVTREDAAARREVARCVAAVNRVLLGHLARAMPLDPLVVAAGRLLLHRSPSIAGMARHLGVSPRHLERVFQQAVGLTPKLFGRISRFQRVAAVLDHASPAVLAAVALDGGYYDQSHLVRDVRAFAGDTPAALRDALDGELAEYFLRRRRRSHFSKIDPRSAD